MGAGNTATAAGEPLSHRWAHYTGPDMKLPAHSSAGFRSTTAAAADEDNPPLSAFGLGTGLTPRGYHTPRGSTGSSTPRGASGGGGGAATPRGGALMPRQSSGTGAVQREVAVSNDAAGRHNLLCCKVLNFRVSCLGHRAAAKRLRFAHPVCAECVRLTGLGC